MYMHIILLLVTQDFSSIFSTLLPGARAKLSPPEGQSVLDGLEVRVGFGDVWKESLSELSGGQRSVGTKCGKSHFVKLVVVIHVDQ